MLRFIALLALVAVLATSCFELTPPVGQPEATVGTGTIEGLEISVRPPTSQDQLGRISGSFIDKKAVFYDKQQLPIRWDILSAAPSDAVDCKSLRQVASVTLRKSKNIVTFSLTIKDSSLFDNPLEPDPSGFRKATLESLNKYRGPLRGEVCIHNREDRIVAAAAEKTKARPKEFSLVTAYDDITDYGQECGEEIGYLPPFNCLDGQDIPITVNGQPPAVYESGMSCDKPAHLGLAGDQCVPYSKLLRIKTYKDKSFAEENDEVDTVVICRRYKFRTNPDFPRFEDVAVIQHNKKSGSTCWYQMLNKTVGKDARRVPPPHEKQLPDNAPAQAIAAAEFWLKPQQTAGFPCVTCHDSDPFMNSPYVMQVKGRGGVVPEHHVAIAPTKPLLPKNPFGDYKIVGTGAPFINWPKSFSIASTVDDTCTSCHRVGSLSTCDRWAKYSVGRGAAPFTNVFGKTFPNSHWMPVDHEEVTLEDWNDFYGESADEILRCCSDPFAQGCEIEPISQ